MNPDWQGGKNDGRLYQKVRREKQRVIREKYSRIARFLDERRKLLPLFGDRKPFPYLTTRFTEGLATLSPNGRFLAYVSNEPARSEVFVQPFPDKSTAKWQISQGGGLYPRWRRDGRELFYLDATRRIVAVSVRTEERSPSVNLFLFSKRRSSRPAPSILTTSRRMDDFLSRLRWKSPILLRSQSS
jgi:Tol biopolymer transport system component